MNYFVLLHSVFDKEQMANLERANFGSKLGVILATAGSAVGLGNIWRFPYMTDDKGVVADWRLNHEFL